MNSGGTASTGRTTIRLPEALHRRLKVLAAEHGTTMQDLLEMAVNNLVSGAVQVGPQRGPARVPGNLGGLVEAFLDFWQHPKNPTEEHIRRLMENVLGVPVVQSLKKKKNGA